MNPSTANPAPYRPPRPLSAAQTFMWLAAGIAAMFALVSAIFAVKLFLEGRPPFGQQPVAPTAAPAEARTAAAEAPTPPVSTAAASASAAPAAAPVGNFVSGAENILPPEVAHLAKSGTSLSPAGDVPAAPLATSSGAGSPAAESPAPAAALVSAAAAAAVPAAVPAVAAAPPETTEKVTAALGAWAADWSRKDVDAYVGHYAPDFVPAGGLSRAAWAAQRRQRLSRPEAIRVAIDALDVQREGDRVVARFIQHYRAGNQNLREAKTVELALRGSNWLIVQERLGH